MKVKKMPGLISEKNTEPQACESCGEDFICGVTQKECWCIDLNLTEKARSGLRSKFDECLCKKCLEKFAKNRP